MTVKSAKEKQQERARKREQTGKRRGDPEAGHGKTLFGPKRGRNKGGRGTGR